MAPPEPKKPDPLVLLARTSAAKRRRGVWPAIILILLLAGLAGGVGWWAWPHSEYPPLALAVFDQVAHPESKVTLTARFQQMEASVKDPSILGSTVYLREVGSPEFQQAPCDAAGFAKLEWTLPAGQERIELAASYPGVPGHRRGAQATARVYAWPPETGILLVDADSVLIEKGDTDPWNTNNVDLKPQAGAGNALQTAAKKLRLVYLSAGADRATRYNQLRAWLLSHAETEKDALPAGPLLAAGSLPEEERDRFHETTLAFLSEQYRGRRVGVTRDPDLAKRFQQAGLEAWLLGNEGEAAEGVRAVKSWAEFRKALKP